MAIVDVAKLRREQKKLKDEMRSICTTALGRDDKKMTEDEGKRYQKLEQDVKDLDAQIELAERNNKLEMEGSDNAGSDENNDQNRSEKKFSSFGEFLQCVRSASEPGGHVDERLVEFRGGTGSNTTVKGDGGWLVGTEFESGIMKRVYDRATFASRCNRKPISGPFNSTAWNSLNETSRKSGSRFGGITTKWINEGGTVDASKASFKRTELALQKIMALYYATEEQLQDSANLEAEIYDLVSGAIAFDLDEAIYAGDGIGKPTGVLKSPALVTVAKIKDQPAKTITYENIQQMWERLWSGSWSNAVWYINQDCISQLNSMALVIGSGGVPVFLPPSGISQSPYGTIFGRQVIPTEHNETLGTVGDILLADMSQYKLIEKGGLRNESSIHVRFLYDEQVFRFIYRVNGIPMWESALTPAKGINTLSPFVALATRG
jgi:HK97 family phage major capsid protein